MQTRGSVLASSYQMIKLLPHRHWCPKHICPLHSYFIVRTHWGFIECLCETMCEYTRRVFTASIHSEYSRECFLSGTTKNIYNAFCFYKALLPFRKKGVLLYLLHRLYHYVTCSALMCCEENTVISAVYLLCHPSCTLYTPNTSSRV